MRKNKESLQEQAQNSYRNVSEGEKYKTREYGKNRYKNMKKINKN